MDGPQKKISGDRGNREKSPGVSFAEAEEVFDFEERQYQTVHAGRLVLLSHQYICTKIGLLIVICS